MPIGLFGPFAVLYGLSGRAEVCPEAADVTCKFHKTVFGDIQDRTNHLTTIDGYNEVCNLAKTHGNSNIGPEHATETAEA